MEEEHEVVLHIKWSKRRFTIELGRDETVADLRARLFSLTDVLPQHQKLFGLPGVGMLEDATLGALKLRPEHNVMLMGTPSARLALMEEERVRSLGTFSVVHDLDWDGVGGVEDVALSRRRLERRLAHTTIELIHPPRDGKRLLVLDLDYTLFDCKSRAPTVAELGRPGLHTFLAAAYEHYDLCVWSQTSWRWLEAKITELAMLTAPDYRICFVLDRTAMFSVTSVRGKRRKSHEVKALELIWRKFPGRWSDRNTVHIDDLRRNFVLNPQSGLWITPFRDAPVKRAYDRELFGLKTYLTLIAEYEPDFSRLNHSQWKAYCEKRVGIDVTNINSSMNGSSVDTGLVIDGGAPFDANKGGGAADDAPAVDRRSAADMESATDGESAASSGVAADEESLAGGEPAADGESAADRGPAVVDTSAVDGESTTDSDSTTHGERL